MNTVSLFLYLSDVIGNIAGIILSAAVLLTVFICVSWIFRVMLGGDVEKTDFPSEHNPHGNKAYRGWNTCAGFTRNKNLYICAVLLWVTAAMIPSQKTMYMIAASEVSGMAVQSEIGQEIV